MKNLNLSKSFALLFFVLLLSASFTFAQDATKKECSTSKQECSTMSEAKTAKHKCTDECKIDGCDAVKAKEAKLSSADACKTDGGNAVKSADAKHSSSNKCGPECKDGCTDECKVSKVEAKMGNHKCEAACADGCTAKS